MDQPTKPNSKRIKILLIVTAPIGGAGLHTFYLAKCLRRDKFDVTVAFSPVGQPLDSKFRELGIRVEHIKMSRRLNPLKNTVGLFQLYSIIKRGNFDIILMGASIAGFLGRIAGWWARVPISIFTIHLYASHKYLSPIRHRLYLWIERSLDLITDYYVAVSNAIKEEGLRKGIFSEQKITMIYNAIEIERFDPKAVRNLKPQLGLDGQGPVIGTIARIERQKGIPYFLRAMATVYKNIPEARFLLVGDGPLRSKMENLSRSLGLEQSIIFTGWREDTADLLACMDIFCLSSLWEAFGIVLIEAMAMKRPIVATNIDGVSEVVEKGKTGLLVPPEDPKALADCVLKLLRDPDLAQRFGETGRRKVEECFTIERMISQYERLFQELFNRYKMQAV